MDEQIQMIGKMADRQHPASAGPPWRLTQEALDRFAAKAPGMPVTANYNPEDVLGHVTASHVEPGGVYLSVALDPSHPISKGLAAIEESGFAELEVGPAFAVEEGMRQQPWYWRWLAEVGRVLRWEWLEARVPRPTMLVKRARLLGVAVLTGEDRHGI